MMIKVVINRDFGGFGLSKVAIDMYCASKGIAPGEWNSTWGFYDNFSCGDIPRDDPILVQIVEEMGSNANGDYAELKVVEIPDDADWYIEEYDGSEWVAERHRTWR
jgi:hypothetical protein